MIHYTQMSEDDFLGRSLALYEMSAVYISKSQ